MQNIHTEFHKYWFRHSELDGTEEIQERRQHSDLISLLPVIVTRKVDGGKVHTVHKEITAHRIRKFACYKRSCRLQFKNVNRPYHIVRVYAYCTARG
jgi:hypothetical protein